MLNLRWFGAKDLLLIDIDQYVTQPLRVIQNTSSIKAVGVLVNGHMGFPWANVLAGFVDVNRIVVCINMNDQAWST